MANEHIQIDRCGFDRNSSISEHTYFCDCGWRAHGSAPSAPSRDDEPVPALAAHLDRGDSVSLASHIISNLDTGSYDTVTDREVKQLADAVLVMDEELRRLYLLRSAAPYK